MGLSVARILMQSGQFRVLGCDATTDHAGAILLDQCLTVPRADTPDYLDAIASLVARLDVQYVIPISEPEIDRVFRATVDGWRSATLVLAQGQAIPIGLDKLATAEFVKAVGLPAPWTMPSDAGDPPELPCVMKARRGWGSRSVVLIEDRAAMEFYRAHRKGSIFQELLTPADEEYTCGLFRSASGEVRTIIFRRRLMGGITGYGVVVRDDRIEHVLHTVARRLDLRGSINIQLRLTVRGPTIFEINPRFSSTVMFRELLGFRDVLWAIDDLDGREVPPFSPPVGARVYRVFSEIVRRVE